MSARANAQSRPPRGPAGLAEQAEDAATTVAEFSPSAERSEAAAQQQSRCSPDPMQHTDRYRLVTPFSLRF